VDDDVWQDVFPVYAGMDDVASRGQMGLGLSFPAFPGHFSRILRSAAPGSGVGTFRARAMGAVPGASPGILGAAAFSAGHGAGDSYAVGAAAGDFRQGVRPAGARRADEFGGGFVVGQEKRDSRAAKFAAMAQRSSLRRPTLSQECKQRKKSACFARNDSG
jgi:hypothetical protein